MGFNYRNRDSQRAEMYEKKVNDRVESDTLVLNDMQIVTEHGAEIIERIVKLEARIEELNFNIQRLFLLKDKAYGKLDQHDELIDILVKGLKEHIKAE